MSSKLFGWSSTRTNNTAEDQTTNLSDHLPTNLSVHSELDEFVDAWQEASEGGQAGQESISLEGEVETATGRWAWLRGLTSKAVSVCKPAATHAANLLQVMGESEYKRVCVNKFHRDRVKINKAKAALGMQYGTIPHAPHRSLGVTVMDRQDLYRADLIADAVCVRAAEVIYLDDGEMMTVMTSEFAERVYLPHDTGTNENRGAEAACAGSVRDPICEHSRIRRKCKDCRQQAQAQAETAGAGSVKEPPAQAQPAGDANADTENNIDEAKQDDLCKKLAEAFNGDWSADPKWAVVRLKRGVLRGDTKSQGILVVFRGTHSLEDTMHDFLCIPTAHHSGVLLHGGVNLALSRTAPAILEALIQALEYFEIKSINSGEALECPEIFFTGHSYGGALALALSLHSLTDTAWERVSGLCSRVVTVTFGAPLVFGYGSSEGSQAYLKQIHSSSRQYVHQGDVVPRLLGRQGQELLQAISKWRGVATRTSEAASEAAGEASVARPFLQSLLLAVGSSAARGLGGGRASTDCSVELAASIVGSYQPLGSFRFVYSVTEASQTGHYIRVVESEKELDRLLELDAHLIWFIHLLLRDHSTDDYRTKVSPSSKIVHVAPLRKE